MERLTISICVMCACWATVAAGIIGYPGGAPYMQSSWGQGYPYMQFNKYMQQPMLQGSLIHYNAFMQYPQYPKFQGQQFGRGYGKGKTGLGMWNQGTGLGQGWGMWNQGMGYGYGGGKWNTNMGLGFGNQFAYPFHGLSGFGGGWGQGQFMNPWINGVIGGIGGLGKMPGMPMQGGFRSYKK